VTVDWYVLLTPIVLLIVVLPFVFIGCAEFHADTSGTGTTTAPPAPAGGGATAVLTTFRFEMDANLQKDLNAQQRVTRIEVFFRIQRSIGTPVPAIERPQPHRLIVNSQQPGTGAIDPAKEAVPPVEVSKVDIGDRNEVVCNCIVTQANGNTPNVQLDKAVPISLGGTYEFRIASRKPNQNGFRVRFNAGM
jgi:hypothetical protein